MLNKLPDWLNPKSSGALFQLLNVAGRESEIIRHNSSQLRDELHPLYADEREPVNISIVTGITPRLAAYYYGKKGQYTFRLIEVSDENDFFSDNPTRLVYVSRKTLNANVPLLSLRFFRNFEDNLNRFIAVSDAHPVDADCIFYLDEDGNIISNTAAETQIQSYEATGIDEEIEFVNKEAQLAYQPIWKGSLYDSIVVYDILNLTNGQPTDVTSNVQLSGKTLTWTAAEEPEGRYIVEYEYSIYNGIRNIVPHNFRFDVAEGNTYSFLDHENYLYSPSIAVLLDNSQPHSITGNNHTKEINIVRYYTDENNNHYLYINPFELRPGRKANVTMIGSNGYTQNWTVSAQGISLDMPALDPAFLETSPSAIQLFQTSDNTEISHEFMRSVDADGKVHIAVDSDSPYIGQSVQLNVYYSCKFDSSDILAQESTDQTIEIDGKTYYMTLLDVEPLVNQSLTLPEIDDFTVTTYEEVIAQHNDNREVLYNDQIYLPSFYLERYQQMIYIKDRYDASPDHRILLGSYKDGTTGIWHTAIDPEWDYRDMTIRGDHLLLLKSEIDSNDTNYLPKVSGGSSRIELLNIFSGEIDRRFDDLPGNAVSLTVSESDHLSLLVHGSDPDTSAVLNVLYIYRLAYDYILLSDAEDGSKIAYVREAIDELVQEEPD
jgi:hypothetical protein